MCVCGVPWTVMVREVGRKIPHCTEIETQWIRRVFSQDNTKVRVSVA